MVGNRLVARYEPVLCLCVCMYRYRLFGWAGQGSVKQRGTERAVVEKGRRGCEQDGKTEWGVGVVGEQARRARRARRAAEDGVKECVLELGRPGDPGPGTEVTVSDWTDTGLGQLISSSAPSGGR